VMSRQNDDYLFPMQRITRASQNISTPFTGIENSTAGIEAVLRTGIAFSDCVPASARNQT